MQLLGDIFGCLFFNCLQFKNKNCEEKEMKIGIEKKIEMQQAIIDELQEKNKLLAAENKQLKTELGYEKIKPQDGYEEAKKLMVTLEETRKEYEVLIKELKEKNKKCDEQLLQLKELKFEYKKKMEEVIASL